MLEVGDGNAICTPSSQSCSTGMCHASCAEELACRACGNHQCKLCQALRTCAFVPVYGHEPIASVEQSKDTLATQVDNLRCPSLNATYRTFVGHVPPCTFVLPFEWLAAQALCPVRVAAAADCKGLHPAMHPCLWTVVVRGIWKPPVFLHLPQLFARPAQPGGLHLSVSGSGFIFR